MIIMFQSKKVVVRCPIVLTLQCNKQLNWIGRQGGLQSFPEKLSTSHITAGSTGSNAPNENFLHCFSPNRIINLEIYITQ